MLDMTKFTRDLNAPRFRFNKHIIDRVGNKFYIRFKKKYPQYSKTPDSTLKLIISRYNELLWQSVIDYRDGCELPEGLGYIFVGTCKAPTGKKFNINIKKSLEAGIPLRHKNFESDARLAKIFYTNYATKYHFQHRDLWEFEATRKFKTGVSSTYPANWKKYIEIDSSKLINKMYYKQMRKNLIAQKVAAKNAEAISPDYNEFDIN